jgi:hypothetical protein
MWNLLAEGSRWNPGVDHGGAGNTDGKKIERVLMMGLATGYGKLNAERCAKQIMLAVRYFKAYRNMLTGWTSRI